MRVILSLIAFISTACTPLGNEIVGDWKVDSDFYNANYRIASEEGKLTTKVLYYNDGTTRYQYDGTQSKYIFHDLQEEGDVYTDGSTGATTSNKNKQNTKLELIHPDTLLISSYILQQQVTEKWIRYEIE